MKTAPTRAMTLTGAVLLFGINAWVCGRLWGIGSVDQMGSSEGTVLALIRHIQQHWGDLRWFPEWFCGMPFVQVYQPGLHASAALLSALTSLPAVRAYHLLAAVLYSLGPVTLYWLCCRLTGSRIHGFLTGLFYSLFSPSGALSAVTRQDMGGWLHARRYQVLVHYGEGPHLAVLTLIPLAIWALDEALRGRRRMFLPLAAILFGAAVATNWTGTTGLAVASGAYVLSQAGNLDARRWRTGLGIAALAYLLVCPWVPPSVVALFPGNAQASAGVFLGGKRLLALAGLAVLLSMTHFVLQRMGTARGIRFFLYFFLISGFLVLPSDWADLSVIPQARRLHLEMEMAFAGAAMYPLARFWEGAKRPARIGMAGVLVLLSVFQMRTYRAYTRAITRPIPIQNTLEYREAQWFERNLPGRRVFAPGSVSVWMNAFTDAPQMVGCCDQGVPSREQRIAFYPVYVRGQAGNQEAAISILWLKAYGAAAVGVSGPHSTEFFKPFTNPAKFEGVLPVLWREGDDVIYEVTGSRYSLAHVIRPEQEVRRASIDGLDVAPLRPFVAALDDGSVPRARFEWQNLHQARIETEMQPGQILSVQVSYSPGWRAEANGAPVAVRHDALGLMILEPQCHGACRVTLTYSGGAEARWTRAAQWIGIGLCLGWLWVTGRPAAGPDRKSHAVYSRPA